MTAKRVVFESIIVEMWQVEVPAATDPGSGYPYLTNVTVLDRATVLIDNAHSRVENRPSDV